MGVPGQRAPKEILPRPRRPGSCASKHRRAPRSRRGCREQPRRRVEQRPVEVSPRTGATCTPGRSVPSLRKRRRRVHEPLGNDGPAVPSRHQAGPSSPVAPWTACARSRGRAERLRAGGGLSWQRRFTGRCCPREHRRPTLDVTAVLAPVSMRNSAAEPGPVRLLARADRYAVDDAARRAWSFLRCRPRRGRGAHLAPPGQRRLEVVVGLAERSASTQRAPCRPRRAAAGGGRRWAARADPRPGEGMAMTHAGSRRTSTRSPCRSWHWRGDRPGDRRRLVCCRRLRG